MTREKLYYKPCSTCHNADCVFIGREDSHIKCEDYTLEQEPQTFKWCADCREYDQEKHCCHRWTKVIRNTVEEMKQEYIEREVLDKIKGQMKDYLRGVEITLEVLVENDPLRPKMEGAKDTLEECLELIDRAEGSDKE